MSHRSVLPMFATIPPGATTRLHVRAAATFHIERLLVSPQSFPLSWPRRAWTWAPVTLGSVLGRAHRGLARLLRVDLHAPHERREYVSEEQARSRAETAGTVEDEVLPWDENEGSYYVSTSTPLNRRERLLAPFETVARYLAQLRLRWQLAQLATVGVRDIRITRRPQLVDSAAAPGLLHHSSDEFVHLDGPTGSSELDIEIEVYNGSRRECQLVMSLTGTVLASGSHQDGKRTR